MYSKPEHTFDFHDGRPRPGCGACIWEQAVEATLDRIEREVARREVENWDVGKSLDLSVVVNEVRERVK